jgi:lipopolysaccharide transport system permease protein
MAASMGAFRGFLAAYWGPLKHLVVYRDLFLRLIRRDIISRTSGTLLGAAWLIIQPGLQVLAFWFLLDFVLKVRSPGRVAFLDYFLVAMLPWLFISDTLSRSLGVLSEFSSLYQRTIFPVAVLPLIPLGMSLLVYGPVYAVVCGVLIGPGAAAQGVAVLGLMALWLLPWVYLLAIVGLFFKESRQLVPFLLTMVMYVTPILYQPAALPDSVQTLLAWNVVADGVALIEGWLFDSPVTPRNGWQPVLMWLVTMPLSWWLFRRAEPHLREAL